MTELMTVSAFIFRLVPITISTVAKSKGTAITL